MRRLRNKKGQSTIEYIVVFTAITLALVVVAYTKLKPAVEDLMGKTAAKITADAGELVD